MISKDDKPLISNGTEVVNDFNESLDIRGLDFRYEGTEKNVLDSISLSIIKNNFVAFVGPSGSGKSTLADLILRNYLPSEGEIFLDSLNISEIDDTSWRKIISIVDQDCYLFNDSILNNIKYGYPKATEDEVLNAAKLSGAEDFISKLPMGYETIVGNRGTSLSGGERQRISLARSLIMKPKILILDEATSSLDSVSEKLIQESLKTIRKFTTLIVIAHRLSTIKDADKIVVLKMGKLIEIGSHDAIMK